MQSPSLKSCISHSLIIGCLAISQFRQGIQELHLLDNDYKDEAEQRFLFFQGCANG